MPTGVVFSISPKNIKRISLGANIVCKFIGTNLKSAKIKKGMKLYIYETSPISRISKEAIISNVEFLNILELLKKYKKDKLFAPVEDLKDYAKYRINQKMIILTIKNLKNSKEVNRAFFNPGIGHQYIYD